MGYGNSSTKEVWRPQEEASSALRTWMSMCKFLAFLDLNFSINK